VSDIIYPIDIRSLWPSCENCQKAIGENRLSNTASRAFVGSAHVMGGMAMGEDLERCVVDSIGKYHYLDNLYVIDGSLLPISVGSNPQLPIYAMACKQATQLAENLTSKELA